IARQQAGAADTTIRLTQQSAGELSKYVNEYEEVVRGSVPLRNELLFNLVRPTVVIDKGDWITVTLRDGRVDAGQILSASDSLLILWNTSDVFDWRGVAAHAEVLYPREIERIEERSYFWPAFGGGALVAGYAG